MRPWSSLGQRVARVDQRALLLNADFEIHGVAVDGPFVDHGRFAVRFTFDETHTPTGTRRTTSKVSLYTVIDGKITREDAYYHEAPHIPA